MHNEYSDSVENLDVDLSYCDRADDRNILICDKYFMIDLLDGGKEGYLRAVYCPNEISGNKNFNKCAYSLGEYIYGLNYQKDTAFCYYVKTDLGRKVCKPFGFPII